MQHLKKAFACVTGLMLLSVTALHAQPSPGAMWPLRVDSMLATRGPKFERITSQHFVLYTEAPTASPKAMLDSLESAWSNAVKLLDASVQAKPPITVFVTASRTRFGLPGLKGLQVRTPEGVDLVLMVRNDSVKAYYRHEVMHAVVQRAWPTNKANIGWIGEGLATIADGRCLDTSVGAAARDVLRKQPSITARDIVDGFYDLADVHRSTAYVLAASLVDFLWTTRGRESVQQLWNGKLPMQDVLVTRSAFGATGLTNVTREWREFVEDRAKGEAGVDWEAFQRFGCG